MPKVIIKTENCKGCEYCIIACPKNVLAVSGDINVRGVKSAVVKDLKLCTGCALCAQVCPDVCIEVWK